MIMAPLIKNMRLTRADDIRLANDLRADMCGLCFSKPPRHLSDEQAAGLAGLSAIPFVERVMRFWLTPMMTHWIAPVGAVSPHRIQLQGDKSPARVAEFKRHATPHNGAGFSPKDRRKRARGLADGFFFDNPRRLPGGGKLTAGSFAGGPMALAGAPPPERGAPCPKHVRRWLMVWGRRARAKRTR
ncbi:MAG: hypothetical protein CM15mP55_2360 [Hyphomicrobiales bacterium]|nr:MAG: hypothetical protein CM15mP55_2360 [Hyphomicrobiales bacterium]